MSGITRADTHPEQQLARDERKPRRYPCTDPHRIGCRETAGQKHRACIDCNRKRGQVGTITHSHGA